MKKEVGLWIDHREAILVFVLDDGEEIKRVISNVSASSGEHNDSSEDKRDRRFNDHLSKYYDEVIVAFGDADSILILGPGEAKVELQNHFQGHEHSGNIVAIKPADKMTDNQIVAEVRQHFRESQHG